MEIIKISIQLKLAGLQKELEVEGHRLALVGPSGCGKSTAAKVLTGVSDSGKGNFFVGGNDLMLLPPWKRSIGYTPQDLILLPHLSVKENLLFPVNSKLDEKIIEGLHLKSLLERMPRYLSGGEKQRVALGRSLMGNPKVLILDEPFSSLDPTMKERVVVFINQYTLSKNLPFILISHDSKEIEHLNCLTVLF